MQRPALPVASAAVLAGILLAGTLPSLSRAGDPAPGPSTTRPLSAVASLGKRMFFDPSLSGSGAMSCAFCHDPANHYGPRPGADTPVVYGGPKLDRPGLRTVPTLTYKELTPPFTIGPSNPESEAAEAAPMAVAETSDLVPFSATNAFAKLVVANRAPKQAKAGNTSANMVARGGLFWDGRAGTLQDQALGPLLSPFEMANTDIPSLARAVKAGYGKEIGQLFGAQILKDPTMTVDEAAYAIARFEIEDPSFHPFTSKYDAYLAGKAKLTPAEARGLKLFNDPKKGNCAACHLDTPGANGAPPMFTDYEFEALAVPRNPAIPANGDPAYHDLGICGPLRTDAAAHQAANCGLFKTPTLRNVASRPFFFHNGIYHSLTDVVRFYVERDTEPQKIYPKGPDGKPALYNDLPRKYWGNIDRIDAPLDRHLGEKPALDAAEIADVVAFLHTLTDGWHPPVR
ncbi:cytochrome-c peroxidase [Solirhodobacter olei]|uniref:cytochrome-c peroxidase n=1 Tax=Solirhodobacter olei TaxID=2493082 RepID=UPI000FDC50FF|nr:cytochrome c peroxidase [Solirhodobacter olei]